MKEPTEHHLRVVRQARVACWGGAGPGISELWILLHGYRQLAPRFLRHFRVLVADSRLLVAPEGLSRFYLEGKPGPHRGGDPVGASWMTREDRLREIEDYVAYLDNVLAWALRRAGEGARVRIVGFSQGVHTAARWVALGEGPSGLGPAREPWLVLWGSALPADLPKDAGVRLSRLDRVILVRGEADALRSPEGEAREEAWFSEQGVRPEIRHHRGGHRIDGAVLAEIAEEAS